jgi:nitronate monooxygenase
MEQKGAKLEELLPLLSGQRGRQAYDSGDISGAVISVGQAVGLIHDIPSAREIIERIISEAKVIMQRLYSLGTSK